MISHLSEISCSPDDSCLASLILLNQKSFYDAQLNVRLFMRDNGICGVIFRA